MRAAFYKFAGDGDAKHCEQILEGSDFFPGERDTREKAPDVLGPTKNAIPNAMMGEGLIFLQDINETKFGVPRLRDRPLGSQLNSLTTLSVLEPLSRLVPSPNLSLSYS